MPAMARTPGMLGQVGLTAGFDGVVDEIGGLVEVAAQVEVERVEGRKAQELNARASVIRLR